MEKLKFKEETYIDNASISLIFNCASKTFFFNFHQARQCLFMFDFLQLYILYHYKKYKLGIFIPGISYIFIIINGIINNFHEEHFLRFDLIKNDKSH